MPDMRVDPYAPPTAELDGTRLLGGERAEMEQIRRAHLTHEARIRGASLFFILPAIALGLAAPMLFGTTLLDANTPVELITRGGAAILLGLIGALYGWVALGLRRLNPAVRTIATVLAAFMMLYIPIGTLFGAYIVYLLRSSKGGTVFTETYRTIREDTPHIVYRTSPIAWAALIALVGFLVASVLFAV